VGTALCHFSFSFKGEAGRKPSLIYDTSPPKIHNKRSFEMDEHEHNFQEYSTGGFHFNGGDPYDDVRDFCTCTICGCDAPEPVANENQEVIEF
jgi:hypothetical protein